MTNFKERLKTYGLNKVLSYMDSDYENNIPKALDWLERFDKEGQYAGAYKTVREVMANPNNNWNQYLKSVFSDLDEGSRRMLLENFIINASIIGNKKREEIGEREKLQHTVGNIDGPHLSMQLKMHWLLGCRVWR